MIRLSRGQMKGDTIVEVLIAMTVVSSVLAGAFVATNRSAAYQRDSQERSEALTLAQSQVEMLRIKANNPLDPLVHKCFDDSGNPVNTCDTFTSSGTITCNPATATYCYKAIFDQPNISVGDTTYRITVEWPSLTGTTGQVRLYYRIPTL